MFDEPPIKQILLLFLIPAMGIVLWVIILCCASSCTVSLTNISTHGTATDIVDEEMSPTNTVNPDLKISPGFL